MWRVLQAERASGEIVERPARVRHVLQVVPGGGDAGVASVAAAQRGVVELGQLRVLGFSRGAVASRRARGWLHSVLPRVFAVGHGGLAPLTMETAALLYAGGDCVLSHATAAALWGMVPSGPADVWLTAIARHIRAPAGVIVHRAGGLDARDVVIRHGLPVTSAARTLIDFAARASDEALAAGLDEARLNHHLSDAQIEEAVARSPRRCGVARLRALLVAQRGPSITRSEAERRLRALIRDAQLPWPQFNVWLHGYLVDALWPDHRLVVEVDGYGVHSRRATFESDRRRDQQLVAAGSTVIRITRRQLAAEPMAVLASLAQALARLEPVR